MVEGQPARGVISARDQLGLIVNADNTITLEDENFLNSLSSFKNISIVTGINPIDAWTMMQSADVLILARSTFSIIPALLIQDGTVISPIGFFRGPREWIYLDDSAELSLQNIRRIIDKRITLTQSWLSSICDKVTLNYFIAHVTLNCFPYIENYYKFDGLHTPVR